MQKAILDAAIRAPSGGNPQAWRFLLVDSPDVKAQIGPVYRECLGGVFTNYYGPRIEEAKTKPNDAEAVQFLKVIRSAQYLADNFEKYPLLLFGFGQGAGAGGAVFPALWNASARRSRPGCRLGIYQRLDVCQGQSVRHPRCADGQGWI